MNGWVVERLQDTAGHLHDSSAGLVAGDPSDGPLRRTVRVVDAVVPSIVLGRAEPEDHVDAGRAAAAGLSVVRRRSGGGSVVVGPGRTVWIDIAIPSDDPLWEADVGRAMWWIGEVWAAALGDVGIADAAVWRGPMVRTAWSDMVCFAGLGAGEVTVPSAGVRAKAVGVAQRRTRRGALFQCCALVTWDPAETLDVLALPPGRRREGRAELAGVAVGVGDRSGALVDAVVGRITRGGKAPAPGQLP